MIKTENLGLIIVLPWFSPIFLAIKICRKLRKLFKKGDSKLTINIEKSTIGYLVFKISFKRGRQNDKQ
jgi:hypothetical protein